MTYAEKLKQSISSLPTDPTKEKKFLCQPLLQKRPFNLVYDPNDFPGLPMVKSQAMSSSSSSKSQNATTSDSVSSNDPNTATNTSSFQLQSC